VVPWAPSLPGTQSPCFNAASISHALHRGVPQAAVKDAETPLEPTSPARAHRCNPSRGAVNERSLENLAAELGVWALVTRHRRASSGWVILEPLCLSRLQCHAGHFVIAFRYQLLYLTFSYPRNRPPSWDSQTHTQWLEPPPTLSLPPSREIYSLSSISRRHHLRLFPKGVIPSLLDRALFE
jgi:hypothetical protein